MVQERQAGVFKLQFVRISAYEDNGHSRPGKDAIRRLCRGRKYITSVMFRHLWTWLDSWEGKSEKQRLISNILLKSRKRDITIIYTVQTMQQITKRIRDITDFIAYPIISIDGTYCRMEIFRGPKVSPATRINPARYFNIEPVIGMYNTYEEIKPVENTGEFNETFYHIEDNVAWHRYCKETLGIKDETKIRLRARSIEASINPWGYKSESERKDKPEDYGAM